jgi:hypothetical protein
MPSRRARKRYRRLAADVGLRGDCKKNSFPSTSSITASGGWGAIEGGLGNASLSDLILLRKAMKENRPVPLEHRRPLLETVVSLLADLPSSIRALSILI